LNAYIERYAGLLWQPKNLFYALLHYTMSAGVRATVAIVEVNQGTRKLKPHKRRRECEMHQGAA